ncbi:hypothetical protein J3454_08190 [Erythrobacter sp. NFXS35]|uniref:hypothetical protein n=1 Tax=Erythrobacter sp. NFXS35 TaxID=2818436 RepID=UPI0032DFDAAB
MFFAKALGGCMVVVCGGLYLTGFFDGEQGVRNAVETVRQAEIADNKNAAWGPHCPGLRDKLLGFDANGMPTGIETNALSAIAKLNTAERELKKAGCDIDAAPGALDPFNTREGDSFREVTNGMNGDVVDGSEWGGDPNAFNDTGDDSWGVPGQP